MGLDDYQRSRTLGAMNQDRHQGSAVASGQKMSVYNNNVENRFVSSLSITGLSSHPVVKASGLDILTPRDKRTVCARENLLAQDAVHLENFDSHYRTFLI
jgi:hypothetical protein